MAAKTLPAPTRNTTPASNRTTPAEAADAVSLQPAGTDTEAVRARAYSLWEQAGRPDGDGTEFWFRAEQELLAPR